MPVVRYTSGKTSMLAAFDLVTIPADQVAHYSQEHIFPEGVKVEPGRDVVLPIVRASGAEFL